MFHLARQFRDAEEILIAAPFWDLSFPALLKVYLEQVSVSGLTFGYEKDGRCSGYCKAKRLLYFSTCGGYVGERHLGFEYIKALAAMLGIHQCAAYILEGMDFDSTQREVILEQGIRRLQEEEKREGDKRRMITFVCAIIVLIGGYFLYGKLAEKVFRPDDRPTPAMDHPDGVDYVPMKTWRVFLIQLLNIAGTGPIFGALMGAVFGPVVFLWIVFGAILGGAVHDYMSGMISVRLNGASVSEIVGKYLGNGAKQVMRVFSVVLLVLVGAVFTTSPGGAACKINP